MSGRTQAAVGAMGAVAAHAAYGALVRALLRRNVARLMDGDPAPLLAMYHPDVEMTFPGEHSWGATYRGKAEVEAFLRRFLAAGLRGELGAIWVGGPPWATRIALEFDDHADDPQTGARIYENRAVLVLRTRWGRVVREEVYEDTQKVAAFDAALAARGAGAGAGAVAA
jgi:ketosteroid isomerase-like protein